MTEDTPEQKTADKPVENAYGGGRLSRLTPYMAVVALAASFLALGFSIGFHAGFVAGLGR